MIVVSDTTPIISLLKMDRLPLLHSLFGSVCIPFAVFEELTGNPKYQEEVSVLRESDFVQVEEVANAGDVQAIKNDGLDIGESEAIVLAKQLSADILLMDEAKGRLVAFRHGLQIMGTVGILLQAFKDGFLSYHEAVDCVFSLRRNHRRISENLLMDLMKEIERIESSRQA